jgi:hypothetical protein
MSAPTRADVLDAASFAELRPRLEREVLAAKAVRRLPVGPNMTFLFENRATCLWQVQEMCRVEQITSPEAIQHELDTYNALLPSRTSLSATLLIEVEEPAARDKLLAALVGLHDRVRLELGDSKSKAMFDAAQFEDKRVSSVQFVRFPIDEDRIRALGDLSRPCSIVVDHEAYFATAVLPLTLRAALVEDVTT